MRAIVTGASGLLGAEFCKKYCGSFDKIYQLGRTKANVNAEWINYDLSKGGKLILPQVDVVFHFAGQTSIAFAKENIEDDLNINVTGLLKIINALKKNNKPNKKTFLIIAGTATQIGYTSKEDEVDENFADNPITFYDISKSMAERYLLQSIYEGWIDGCAMRICNVYGGIKEGQKKDRGVIDKIFQDALNGKNINFYGSGECIRDYIYIEDVVSAFYYAWLNRGFVNGKYFYLGTGIGVSLKDAFTLVAKIAQDITGVSVDVSSVDPPNNISKIEFRSFVANNKKLIQATNWKPKFDLESGIKHSYKTCSRRGND